MGLWVVRCRGCGLSRIAVIRNVRSFVFLCHACGVKRRVWRNGGIRDAYGPFGLRAAMKVEEELNA